MSLFEMPKQLNNCMGKVGASWLGGTLVLHTIYTLTKLEIILYQTGIFYQLSIKKHESKPSKLALSFELCSSSFSVQETLPICRYSMY